MTSKITTEDCKKFIQETYQFKNIKELKRFAKYKDIHNNIVREFIHPDVLFIYVIEDTNGILSLSQTKPEYGNLKKETSTTTSIFTPEDTAGAKKLVKSIVKKIENEEADFDDEEFISEIEDSPYFHALASQFSFNFPYDVYENFSKNVTNGIDTLFDSPKDDSFCIRFYDKNKSESDLYLTNVLILTSYADLSEWLDFSDEYHLSLSHRSTTNMSVKDVFEKLIAMGFDYSPKSNNYIEDDCLFQKEFKEFLLQKQ